MVIQADGAERRRCLLRTMATVVITVAMLPGMTFANEADGSVARFIKALEIEKREDASKMVYGRVAQVSGLGPIVQGGPHEGVWNKRIIDGAEDIPVEDAFETFASCRLDAVEKPNSFGAHIRFACPMAVTVYFDVGPAKIRDKVTLFGLGRDLNVVPAVVQ